MKTLPTDILKSIPQVAQSQAALDDQLSDLMAVANKLGLYDAADYLRGAMDRSDVTGKAQ